jgi:O-antigen/teichoic acid export membrane protein
MARLISTGRVLLGFSAVAGMLFILALSAAFSVLFDIPTELTASARVSLLLLGGAAVLAIVETAWTATLVGIGRMDVPSMIGLALTTALAALQVLLAFMGAGIEGLAAASLAIALVSLFCNRYAMRRRLGNLPKGNVSWKTARGLLSLGSSNMLVSLSGVVSFGSDVLIVGALAGPAPAAAYAVASRAATFARNFATSASDVLIPNFGNAYTRGDTQRLQALYRSSAFMGLIISIPLALCFLGTASPLLRLWAGEDLPGASVTLMTLSVLTVTQIPGHVAFICLMGTQRSRLLLRFSLPSAAANGILSVIFTMLVGVAGPALGSLLATLLVDPFLVRRLAADILHLSGRHLYRQMLALTAVPTLFCVPLVLGANYIANSVPAGIALLLGGAIALLFLAASIVWLRVSGHATEVAPAIRALPVIGNRLARFVSRAERP